MSGRLRWGIVGAGWIARRFAADLSYGDTGRVTRIAGRRPDHATALAARFGAEVSARVEDLVAARDVDAVYVATPAHLHVDHCRLALSHGKPVLCEKPFALSADQATEIANAAESAGVFCMEAMWTRFLPAMTELRKMVRRGEIGDIRQLDASLGFPNLEGPGTATLTDPARGGGALLDLGIYGLSVAHDLLGPPKEVAAWQIRSESGSVRDVTVTMRHETTLSTVRASHAARLANRLEVSGTDGTAQLDAPYVQAARGRFLSVRPDTRSDRDFPSRLQDRVRGSRAWPIIRAVGAQATGRGPRRFGGSFLGYGLHFQADEVAACLSAGKIQSEIMPLAESVAVLRTADLVRRCLAEAGTATLEEP